MFCYKILSWHFINGASKNQMEYVLSIFELPKWSFRQGREFFHSFAIHLKDHFVPHHRNNYHPHIFSHRMLVLFSGLMVSLKIFTIALISIGPVLPAFSSAITPENIISLTNVSRKEAGLLELKENSILSQAAQVKANDMLAKGYFSHNTPDGKTPWSFIASAGYSYLMAGENLAVNFTEAENVESAWMNSPGHKANILNKNFEEIGIGIAQGTYQDHSAIFVVQMFGTPSEQKVVLSERPTILQPATPPAKEETEPNLPPVKKLQSTPKILEQKLVEQEIKPVLPALEILNTKTEVTNNSLKLTAEVSSVASKVILNFGEQTIMLDPKPGNQWQAQVDLSRLALGGYTLRLLAYDIKGNFVSKQLESFKPSTVENYKVLGAETKVVQVNWMGKIFNPKVFESQLYLLFIAGILTSLIVAILVHRHIQHVAVIANGSFLAIVACLLFMAG